jgi:hypothetical protein
MAKLTNTQKDKLIAAAQNSIEFSVQGRGMFPFDMLRYDLCWPASESDSALLFYNDPHSHRHINLKGLKTPTAARWHSFGWEVVEASS